MSKAARASPHRATMPVARRQPSFRALSDELLEQIAHGYLDRTGADDPLALFAAPLTELCAIFFGRDRCGPGGAADDDRRIWKRACAILGLAALPTYPGAPTSWRAAYHALRARDPFRSTRFAAATKKSGVAS